LVETSPGSGDYVNPPETAQWIVSGLVFALSVVWLSLRGRPRLGALAVFLPTVIFQSYRAATGEVIGANMWPIGSIFYAILYGLIGAIAIGAGVWVRRRYAEMVANTRQ
jgi:hypothetical protein